MKYDLEKTYDCSKAMEYLKKLIEDGSKAELKKIYPKRSTSQNSYLHVLFTLWGLEFGYTIDEAKDLVKDELGYTYENVSNKLYNKLSPFSRVPLHRKKTSAMDSKELTIFIDKFRDWSAQTCGLYLPSSEEYIQESVYFDNQIENNG